MTKKHFTNMDGRTKIHPSPKNLSLKILSEEDITPAEAIDHYAMIIAYEKLENIKSDLLELENENKRLNRQKNKIDKKIIKNNEKIEAMKKELKDYKSDKYNVALMELKPIINNVIDQVENNNRYGYKVKLTVIYDIADKNNIDWKKLLKKIDKDIVKKYVENGGSIR